MYAYDNPVTYTDPSGYNVVDITGGQAILSILQSSAYGAVINAGLKILTMLRMPTDENGKQINWKEVLESAIMGGMIAGGLTGLYLLASYVSSVALFIFLGGVNLYFAMEMAVAAGMAFAEKDYPMAALYGTLGIFAAIGVKESFSNASQISMARSTARSMTNSNIGNACRAGSSSETNARTVDDIISNLNETTNGKGVARNFESTGGFDQTLNDFDSLNPLNVKEIQTQYGTGKVGTLNNGTTVIARPGSKTGGATLEIKVSNKRVYKIRY